MDCFVSFVYFSPRFLPTSLKLVSYLPFRLLRENLLKGFA